MADLTLIERDWCEWLATLPQPRQVSHDIAESQSIEAFRAGAARERARIRRELLERLAPEIRMLRIPGSQAEVESVLVADLRAALDSIAPKED